MSQLHLVIGPVGAGKSTWARAWATQRAALFLEMDRWVTALFEQPQDPSRFLTWYSERAKRCLPLMWQVARESVVLGREVVWELGFVRRHERDLVYHWADEAEVEVGVHVLDAPEQVRWTRVQLRNAEHRRTGEMVVSEAAFRRVSQLWQAPSAVEVQARRGRGGVFWVAEDSSWRPPAG